MRARMEDFKVEEISLYPAAGHGEHTFLWVEKRGANTEEVARELARSAGVPAREVGFAGRKDRWAVTRQWFSVPRLDPDRACQLPLVKGAVLAAERHPHKLRTAHLRGNRFTIVVREVDRELGEEAQQRWRQILLHGFPNRYGPQRFGRSGRNAELGAEILQGGKVRGDRRQARFLVSALQSAVFNQVLARRPVPLHRVTRGDVAVVHDSGGLFLVEDEAKEAERAVRFEISATGPILGTKMKHPTGEVLELETAVVRELGLPPVGDLVVPRGLRLAGGRRALRARPEDAACRWVDNRLELEFALTAGSYATVLLAELFAGQTLAEGPADGAQESAGRGEV